MSLRPSRVAADGSPYPRRGDATFERDVQAMFTHIVGRYDWFDHVASLGNDFVWRPRALWDVDRYREGRPLRAILDVGCGTGDLTRLARRYHPQARVVGADFTRAMLARAAALDGNRPGRPHPSYVRGTAARLPFRSGVFDLVMSAFVARNLPRLPESILEFRRILAPGGTLLTLEITEPPSLAIRSLFHAYFDHIVPWLGRAVHSAGPYRYLPESLHSLPTANEMKEILRLAGLARVEARPQSLGIVTAYLGELAESAAKT